jgi:hypothetical protein
MRRRKALTPYRLGGFGGERQVFRVPSGTYRLLGFKTEFRYRLSAYCYPVSGPHVSSKSLTRGPRRITLRFVSLSNNLDLRTPITTLSVYLISFEIVSELTALLSNTCQSLARQCCLPSKSSGDDTITRSVITLSVSLAEVFLALTP